MSAPAQDFALGLDLGTSSLKALVIDASARVVATASRGYPLERPSPGRAEQQPEEWWRAATGALADLAARGVRLDRIASVGLSGQMHGLLLLDSDGAPIAPCHTWADARCSAEARQITEQIGNARLRAITGGASHTSATAAKLLWLRAHQPACYAAARHLVLPKDYLRWRMTGDYATDPSDASGTLLCDITTRGWSSELLDALEIPVDLLPRIVESAKRTGVLTADAARQLGLRPGIPVAAGGGDAACAALGMGLLGDPSDAASALATLGTAGQFSVVATNPLIDPLGRMQTLCHVMPRRWYLMSAILAGGSALAWLASILLPAQATDRALDVLLEEAASEPVGARGLLFVPHLNGVRLPDADTSVAGAFVGLRPEHTRATLTRAAVEGVALSLRDGLVAARELGITIERIRLAGGVNRAPLWAQVQADVFGVPVEVAASADASARGAALLAAASTGLISALAEGSPPHTEATRVFEPHAEASAHYAELHARLTHIIAALR